MFPLYKLIKKDSYPIRDFSFSYIPSVHSTIAKRKDLLSGNMFEVVIKNQNGPPCTRPKLNDQHQTI